MATRNVSDHRSYASILVDRLGAAGTPRELRSHVLALKAASAAYESAHGAAEKAREARDDALEAIGDADDALDASVEALAVAMVSAGLAARAHPFAGFSKHSPSALVGLGYAAEVKEVRALVKAVQKAKPPAAVAKACAACLARAKAVDSALAGLRKPQAAYTKALAARDERLPALAKAIRKLRLRAKLAWEDDPASYKAAFAPPGALEAPARRSRRTAAKKTAAPAAATQPS